MVFKCLNYAQLMGDYLTTSYFLRVISRITFETIHVTLNGLKKKTTIYSKVYYQGVLPVAIR
jgi:hypothetical protein